MRRGDALGFERGGGMNMVDRRKFRRKFRRDQTTGEHDDQGPLPPLETREERLARRKVEAARIAAEEQAEAARIAAEQEAQAEAMRRARDRAEEAKRRAEERLAAEEEAQRRAAEEQARAEEERQRQAAEEARARHEAALEEARILEMRRQRKEARRRREEDRRKREAETARKAAEEKAAREARERAIRKRTLEEAARKARQEAERLEAEALALAEAEAKAAELRAEHDAEATRNKPAPARGADTENADRSTQTEDRAATEADRAAATQINRGEARPKARTAPLSLTNPVTQGATAPEPDATAHSPADGVLAGPAEPGAKAPVAPWQTLATFDLDDSHLARHRIITARRDDPAHTAFDVLRTRLLQALSENGWRRVAITSPTKDCGKTFTAANLAISLSRQENCRTLLLDCDMRRPTLHRTMGVEAPGSMGDMLRGKVPPEAHLLRLGKNRVNAGHNIAFGFNGVVEPYASELLQDPRTEATLDRIEDLFKPDVVLFDLPPALYYDDVIAFRPLFDGVLLVIGGGITTEKEIKEVERRLGETTPLLGMVLNKAENTEIARYQY